MPAEFTRTFAARLNDLCKVQGQEAEDGERVPARSRVHRVWRAAHEIGSATQTTSSCSTTTHRSNAIDRRSKCCSGSRAQIVGPNAIATMLTGMDNDGAVAMREMRDAGADTLAQDEATGLGFGMPKEALAQGAVQHVLLLSDIAPRLVERVVQSRGRSDRV